MTEQFERTALLLGESGVKKLENVRVAVFGIGGVGGFACEALARSGIGTIDIIDRDTVSVTNLNRQIVALHSTIGKYKVDVMKDRIADINPDCKVNAYCCFFMPDNSSDFDFTQYDYVIDAVDTVTAKLEIIQKCNSANVKIISSMGAGNKLDPTQLQVADIYSTSVCPLARVMRQTLKKRGIKKLKVVYSQEEAKKPEKTIIDEDSKKVTPGSLAFVPSVAGLIIAGEVIKDITEK